MDKITYNEKYYVKSSEVDTYQELRPSSLLKILQDLATEGSKIVDAGPDKTLDKGYLWVFSKLDISIERMPRYQETINLSTIPPKLEPPPKQAMILSGYSPVIAICFSASRPIID